MCKAARDLHRTIGEILAEEVPRLPGSGSRKLFWELMRESVQKNLPPTPPSPPKPAVVRPSSVRTSQSYDDALELIAEIHDLADSICENGQEFAASVVERADSIGESVERGGGATVKQIDALENMRNGLEQWHHD